MVISSIVNWWVVSVWEDEDKFEAEVDDVREFESRARVPALSGWCRSRALWYASLSCCLERLVEGPNGRLRTW